MCVPIATQTHKETCKERHLSTMGLKLQSKNMIQKRGSWETLGSWTTDILTDTTGAINLKRHTDTTGMKTHPTIVITLMYFLPTDWRKVV